MQGIVLELVDETLGREYGTGPWGAGRPGKLDPNEAAGTVGGAAPGDGTERTDAPSDALICWFGRRAIPLLAERYPSLFRKHGTLRSFLESLSDGEDPGGGGAETPAVLARPAPDGGLLLSLPAGRRTCALVKGVIAGAAEHYGERVLIEELKCGTGGDNRCVIRVGLDEAVHPAAGLRSARRRARLA